MSKLNINPIWFLQGYKTYIVGIALIIVGLYKQDMQVMLEGLGLITLRAGVSKIKVGITDN